MEVLKFHASRKAILEVQFSDEEGTGLGPTLEFYSLVATELQRKDLYMWLCDDNNEICDNETLSKYVHQKNGLFPAPLPQNSNVCDTAVNMFWFLGTFLGKVLQDNRLVDMPLSNSFLKLLCSNNLNVEAFRKQSGQKISLFPSVLTIDDLIEIDPIRGVFLKKLQDLCDKRDEILTRDDLSEKNKQELIEKLTFSHNNYAVNIEDLVLNFTYLPSSKVYQTSAIELVENGSEIEVRMDNLREYVNATLDFCLNSGLRRQMVAFYDGFCTVFPIENLNMFMASEVKLMMCGDQCPQWTREDIVNYTEPKLGYNRDSIGFKRFVNVLIGMNNEERKDFLQFTTGCSSLPPGGLANLYPRLTIVRKVDADEGSYPSVNTCVHYLKLPDYPSEELMRERLLAATKAKGFHLN